MKKLNTEEKKKIFLQRVIEDLKDKPSSSSQLTDKAIRIADTILQLAFLRSENFQRFFDEPDDSLSWKMYKADEMHCRLFLRPFVLPNSCCFEHGFTHDIPPGYGLYKLSETLTAEENNVVRTSWTPCMDSEGYISPKSIRNWVYNGIKDAVDVLKQEDREEPAIYGVEKEGSCVLLKCYFRGRGDENGNPCSEDDFDLVKVFFIPTMNGSGWPSQMQLVTALPKRLPYSTMGREAIKAIQDLHEDGLSVWWCEAPGKSTETDDAKKNALWSMNFDIALEIIKNNAWKCCELKKPTLDAEGVMEVLQRIAQHHGWTTLNSATLLHVMLLTIKHHLMMINDDQVFLMKCLAYLKQSIESKYCPHILCPTVNVLNIGKSDSKRWSNDLDDIIEKLKYKTGYILTYIGYCAEHSASKSPKSP